MRLAFCKRIMYNIHIEKILCVYSINFFVDHSYTERKDSLYGRFIF